MLGIILDNAIEGASAAKEEKNRIDHTQEESFRDDSCDQYNNKYITVKPVETKRVLNKNKSKKRRPWLVYLGWIDKDQSLSFPWNINWKPAFFSNDLYTNKIKE